jgi:hypothetical protein
VRSHGLNVADALGAKAPVEFVREQQVGHLGVGVAAEIGPGRIVALRNRAEIDVCRPMRNAADCDYAGLRCALQRIEEQSREVECTNVVDAKLALEAVGREFGRGHRHTGVVHEQIEAVEAFAELLGERVDALAVPYVDLHEHDQTAFAIIVLVELQLLQVLSNARFGLATAGFALARKHDGRAALRQFVRRLEPNARVRARDDGHSAALRRDLRAVPRRCRTMRAAPEAAHASF